MLFSTLDVAQLAMAAKNDESLDPARRSMLLAGGSVGLSLLAGGTALSADLAVPTQREPPAGPAETSAAASRNTADILIESLIQCEVANVFGMVGDGINPLIEALRKRQDRIRFIAVRHEEAAAFMASGYAKHTGKLGVCLATTGPGAVHLMNGLYDAKMDSAPVLEITGSTFHDLVGPVFSPISPAAQRSMVAALRI